MTLLMTILARATRPSTPAPSQIPGLIITTGGASVVAIFGYLATRSGAARTIKQRRGTPDRPEVDGFAIARLTADPEPKIAEVTASQWTRRKWAWFALAAALGAVMVGFGWLALDYFIRGPDFVIYIFASVAALLCEAWCLAAFRRFRTMNRTTCQDAGRFEQEVRVKGDLDVAVRRCEEIIAAMKIAVTAIVHDGLTVTFTGVLPSSQEVLDVRVEDAEGAFVRIKVGSRATPAGSSYRRNTRNVFRFQEQLAGVRMYQRRGKASWTMPDPPVMVPEATRVDVGLSFQRSGAS